MNTLNKTVKSASILNAMSETELSDFLSGSTIDMLESYRKLVALKKSVISEITEQLNVLDELQHGEQLTELPAVIFVDMQAIEEQAHKEIETENLYSEQDAIIEPVLTENKHNINAAIFDGLESNENFRLSLDVIQSAIALSAPVLANANISAEKARLTMINRVSRSKRLDKMKKLNDKALAIIVNNSSADSIESTAIYAVDKVIQISRALSGESAVFGRGKNNTLLYALYGIAKLKLSDVITTSYISGQLIRYSQPHESAQTQASSSLKALLSLDCLKAESKAGSYSVNQKSELMTLLLTEYSK